MAGRAVKAFCAWGGISCSIVPFGVLFVMFHFRWSPIMMPYHVFGGKEVVMKLESQGSVWFWIVFSLDWALMSAGVLAACCVLAILCDAVQLVNLVTKAMR